MNNNIPTIITDLISADIEAIEQCLHRVGELEDLLRYLLQEGMTKEAYRRIGQALENKS